LLYSGEIEPEVWFGFVRIDQQMDMLGHEDESHQVKVEFGVGSVDATREFRSPDIVCEERHPPVARECQLVEMTSLVEVTHTFSMRH
jgi:hypothetical protein